MIPKTVLPLLVAALTAIDAQAQGRRVEVSGSAGWTFSDGVSGPEVKIGTLGSYDRIDPLNAFSWGARVGFLLGGKNEVGFLFAQESTDLDITGASSLKIADVSVRNYHGYFAYNFLARDAFVRPYLLFGLGASRYSPNPVSVAGTTRGVSGDSRLSGTGAIGLKLLPAGRRLGLRLESRWTPTRVKSGAAAFWCGPFWGCYVASKAQYSNQFDWSGGIIVRI
jgi:hypothetical protein